VYVSLVATIWPLLQSLDVTRPSGGDSPPSAVGFSDVDAAATIQE
jgi:hypothetical protein